MVLSRQKFYTAFLIMLLCLALYLSRDQNRSSFLTRAYKKVQDQQQKKLEIDESWLKGPIEVDDPRLLKVIKDRYLIPPTNLPYNLSSLEETGRYYPPNNFSSFHFIDYYVKYLFEDQKPGFFLEAGALEGDIYSNSLWLEKELGWTGVLVEVDPSNFRHLVQKRRKSWLSNTCIARVPYPQQVTFEFLEGPPDHILIWVFRSNSRPLNSPFHDREDGLRGTARTTNQITQCFPLASYILALNRTTLDFLSLDIQGFESDILYAIPYDKVKVRVIAVEYFIQEDNGELTMGKLDPKFTKFMESKGYYLVDFDPESNYIFALKDDQQLKDKLDEKKYVKYYTMLRKRENGR